MNISSPLSLLLKPVLIQRNQGEELSISGSGYYNTYYNITYILFIEANAYTYTFILFSITMDSGDIIEVWDGKSKGPPRKEKFPDKDSIVEKMKKLSS